MIQKAGNLDGGVVIVDISNEVSNSTKCELSLSALMRREKTGP